MTARILVVDDDAVGRYTLRGLLEDEGLAVTEAPDGERALELLRTDEFDLVISDLRMPRLDGMELLRRAKDLASPPRIILLTAHGSERHAVDAMKLGALDYFRKPFEIDEVLAVVRRAVSAVALERENEQLRGEVTLLHSMVFAAPAMSKLALAVRRVAPREVTVLITGESGTGKERVAEALVQASPRADRPFVRFNCAALTSELAEAELFGHSRGAFTGAVRARPGVFRAADGGTLFLDEVAELELGTQAKLLRVLEDREVRPVGEDRTYRVDIRLIAATNRDLTSRVAAGQFREDLYYRLNVVALNIPPLRERPEDIPVLARHFLSRFAERFGLPPAQVGPELIARLVAHSWPGNVRELENCLESAVALSADGSIDLSLLPGPASQASVAGLRDKIAAYERGLVAAALQAAHGNQSEAARILDIGRATLHDKLHKYGLGQAGADEADPEKDSPA